MSVEAGEVVSPYDLLAPVYDRLYDGELNGRADESAIVAGLCETFNPNTKSILDLGSGTATVLAKLSEVMRLDEMVGVEQSPKMIERARQNVPDADFIQGDITNFELGRQFDAVTCLFDTINHLKSAAEWESAFERAAAHLKPGGVFIFDMVTPRLLDGIAKSDGYNWKFDGGECYFDMHAVSDGQYRGDFEIIPDDEQADITKMSIVETAFPGTQVVTSLKKVLDPKKAFDHGVALQTRGSSMPQVTDQTTRIMLLAQKPVELTALAA